MTVKKKTKAKTDRLFEIFCGEAITVMVNRDSEQTTQTETTVETTKAPIVLAGYLVDADDDYLFLGYEPDSINQAIARETVVHVEIMDNPLDDLMSGMETPKTGRGLN